MSTATVEPRAATTVPSTGGRAVVIGPGKLGCGYLAPLFLDAGWQTVLVARTQARADRIRACGRFRIRRVPGSETELPTGAPVVFGEAEFRRAVADADVVVTAVGVENVQSLGPGLARALHERGTNSPIDVLVVENANVAPTLEMSVRGAAAKDGITLPSVGFAGAIASPVVACGDWNAETAPTFVRDGYDRLLVDATRLVGTLPVLPGVATTHDYEVRLREKLYVFSAGHALCAYMGARCGYERLDEAAHDPLLRTLVKECLLEARSALERSHPELDDDGWTAVTAAVRRFENDDLRDPIRRVARRPLRKLAPNGPLVGSARLVREVFGRTSIPHALGVASALLYRDDADPQARQLARMLRHRPVDEVVQRVCGLERDDPFARAVVVAYERMRQSGLRPHEKRRRRRRSPRRAAVRRATRWSVEAA